MINKVIGLLGLLEGKSGTWYTSRSISKEQAYKMLRQKTEEDFGYDVKAWREYFEQFDINTVDGYRAAFKGEVKM